MTEDLKNFFGVYPGTPPIGVEGDYRCSVHYGNTFRLNQAKEQASLRPASVDVVIQQVNTFLNWIGMPEIESPKIEAPEKINYQKMQMDYALKDERDIVWMKFTQDGYLGVVATSNDINFDIPKDATDYDRKEREFNSYLKQYKWEWCHPASGILVHQVSKKWDTSFVLVFPLSNIPSGYNRGDMERAIGNYLISKEIPIIDFYSHNY